MVLVKWSTCSPCALRIWVWVLLKTVFCKKCCLKEQKSTKRGRGCPILNKIVQWSKQDKMSVENRLSELQIDRMAFWSTFTESTTLTENPVYWLKKIPTRFPKVCNQLIKNRPLFMFVPRDTKVFGQSTFFFWSKHDSVKRDATKMRRWWYF